MKKGLLFSVLTAFFLPLSAQPLSRVAAFSREYHQGMVRERNIPAENSGTIPPVSRAAVTYFIYAVMNGSLVPGFRKIWIRGQWYDILQTKKETSPVYSSPPNPMQLIPALKQTIVRIIPGNDFPRQSSIFPALRQMMKQSALIVCYQWKGKYYYWPVQTITLLDPVFSE